MKRILLACLIIFNLVPLYGDTTKESRLLIELHIPATEFENKLTRNFPTVEILATFDTLINGIAIEGNTRHLERDRKSTRLNSSHVASSYAVFCLKKNKIRLDYMTKNTFTICRPYSLD